MVAVGILFIPLLFSSIILCVYAIQWRWCLAMARDMGERPPFLLIQAVLFGIMLWFVVLLLFWLMLSVCFSWGGGAAILTLLCVLCATVMGWIRILKQRRAESAPRHEYNAQLPKLQFRIVDFWAAALVFGGAMLVVSSVSTYGRVSAEFAVWAMLELFACGFSFLIALDVCRRSDSLQGALPRAVYIVLIMSIGAFLPMFPVLVVSWKAWRNAMWKTQNLRGADAKSDHA